MMKRRTPIIITDHKVPLLNQIITITTEQLTRIDNSMRSNINQSNISRMVNFEISLFFIRQYENKRYAPSLKQVTRDIEDWKPRFLQRLKKYGIIDVDITIEDIQVS